MSPEVKVGSVWRASQSRKARGVDTPRSGRATTQEVAGRSVAGSTMLAATGAEDGTANEEEGNVGADVGGEG